MRSIGVQYVHTRNGLYTYLTHTYHKLTFIIEDSSHFAILRKRPLKSGEKQNIWVFAIFYLAHKTLLTKWVLLRFKFWNQFWVSLIALYKSLFFVFFLKKKLKKQNWKYFFFSKKNWKKLKCIKIFRWIFFFRKNIFYIKFFVFERPTYKGTCIPNISEKT